MGTEGLNDMQVNLEDLVCFAHKDDVVMNLEDYLSTFHYSPGMTHYNLHDQIKHDLEERFIGQPVDERTLLMVRERTAQMINTHLAAGTIRVSP